jgi:hypothetical protein
MQKPWEKEKSSGKVHSFFIDKEMGKPYSVSMSIERQNRINTKAFSFLFVIVISAIGLALFFASAQQNTDTRSRASGFAQEKSVFSDMSAITFRGHVAATNYLHRMGITAGCATNPLRFCPERPITRAEAAVFILKAKYGAQYTPPAARGIFSDVPTSHTNAGFIEQMHAEGITAGCATNPLRFCPNDTLTREAVATFIVRAKHGASFAPPAHRGYFSDVDAANPLGKYIEQFMDDGMTAGCATNPLRFCPKQIATRADMALFIYRTFIIETVFSDVAKTYWAAPHIYRVHRAGMSAGCATNPLRFCPDQAANRGQVIALMMKGKYGAGFAPTARGVFADVPATHPFAGFIEKAYDDGLTAGCATNPLRFCPDQTATRGETARFFVTLKYGKNFTPPAYRGTFSDVPQSHPHAQMIEQFEKDAHTVGCDVNPRRYCPDRTVTRAEMAVFLSSVFELP